ncbi:relaxase domain-containing protein [Thermobifida halotolerans]|uniref:relaxase domain-containing protein n=1 Tax=Thermobifida halotolerans TaxID=483545 RepID=UPI00083899C7|nr:relaxase domain-containing protein [Thermobifida halotolerans]
MSRVTKLGSSPEAVNYRLSQTCGQDHARAQDVVIDYRLRGRGRHGIERVGRGWAEFGHLAGTTLDSAAEVEEVRQIMAGRHPGTGEVLVRPKVAVHPNARLAARLLIEAVHAVARQQHTTPAGLLAAAEAAAKRFARLERALLRRGETHRAPVSDLEQVAQASGIRLEQVYAEKELAFARGHAEQRIRVGNQGYDVTITRPRSIDVLRALAPDTVAERMDELFMESVRQAADVMEEWCGYALAGHHGDGRRARRVPTTGWAATITWHRTTRPIDGTPGDPHLHAHIMVPNLVKGADGRWRTVASGGRDLFRHVAAVSEYALALHRRKLSAEYGLRWEYHAATRQWEIAGVPAGLRRSQQVDAAVGAGASASARRAAGRRTAGAKIDTTPEQEQEFWYRRALASGWVPEHVVRSVLGYEPPPQRAGRRGATAAAARSRPGRRPGMGRRDRDGGRRQDRQPRPGAGTRGRGLP